MEIHSNSKERQSQRMLKLHKIALISHASKVMVKIFQARFQHYLNCELPDEEPEIKLPTSAGSSKKMRLFQKNHLLY